MLACIYYYSTLLSPPVFYFFTRLHEWVLLILTHRGIWQRPTPPVLAGWVHLQQFTVFHSSEVAWTPNGDNGYETATVITHCWALGKEFGCNQATVLARINTFYFLIHSHVNWVKYEWRPTFSRSLLPQSHEGISSYHSNASIIESIMCSLNSRSGWAVWIVSFAFISTTNPTPQASLLLESCTVLWVFKKKINSKVLPVKYSDGNLKVGSNREGSFRESVRAFAKVQWCCKVGMKEGSRARFKV